MIKEQKISRQRKWQKKKRAQGLCEICGETAVVGMIRCAKHRKQLQARLMKLRRLQGKPMRRCSSCGIPGHYKNTCGS